MAVKDKMTKKQILKKVIEKAVKNGWGFMGYRKKKNFDWGVWGIDNESPPGVPVEGVLTVKWDKKKADWTDIKEEQIFLPLFTVIFDHSFAKAFWGKKVETEDIKIPCKKCGGKMWVDEELSVSRWHRWFRCSCGNHLGEKRSLEIIGNKLNKGWQYHLQQLALAKDRLKYLEKFLK